MSLEKLNHQEDLLTYLSETLNGCLTISEILDDVTSGEEAKIQTSIGELFALYQATKLYYFLSCAGEKEAKVLHFFTTFEEFYFEVKHVLFYATNTFERNFRKGSKRLSELVALYEEIADQLA